MLNPLDLELDRDPYLTSDELRYFRELGPRLWTYTRVWLHLQEVLSVDIAEWDSSVLEHDLGIAQALLESAPDRPEFGRGGRGQTVDPLVRAYSDSIETGMTGVREAVARLSDAEDVLSRPGRWVTQSGMNCSALPATWRICWLILMMPCRPMAARSAASSSAGWRRNKALHLGRG